MRPGPDRQQLREDLDLALRGLGKQVGTPLQLDARGACGVRISGTPEPVTVEWIPSASCVAVHAAVPAVAAQDSPEALDGGWMKMHLAGAATYGCSFWKTPDDRYRVGLTLIGPRMDQDVLLEALGRVTKLTGVLANPPDGKTTAPRFQTGGGRR